MQVVDLQLFRLRRTPPTSKNLAESQPCLLDHLPLHQRAELLLGRFFRTWASAGPGFDKRFIDVYTESCDGLIGAIMWKNVGCRYLFFRFFFVFQSGALFLAICYILEQKPVLCWILELKCAICTVHRFFHGFSRFFHGVHRFTSIVFIDFSIVFIEFCMVSIDLSMVSIDFSMHNMHLVNM